MLNCSNGTPFSFSFPYIKENTYTHMCGILEKKDDNLLNKRTKVSNRDYSSRILCSKYETWHHKFKQMRCVFSIFIVWLFEHTQAHQSMCRHCYRIYGTMFIDHVENVIENGAQMYTDIICMFVRGQKKAVHPMYKEKLNVNFDENLCY